MFNRISRGVTHPKEVIRRLYKTINNIKDRKYKEAILYFTQTIFGWDTATYLIGRVFDDGIVEVDVKGNLMILDVCKKGISRNLFINGEREPASTEAFRNQLRDFRTDYGEEITCLDIGANIGYYLLQEADILGSNADIIAVEPALGNFEILSENVKINGYENSRIRLINAAMGGSRGTVNLQLSEASNLHRVEDTPKKSQDDDLDETVEVPQYTVQGVLRDNNLSNENPIILRLDVEGYEYQVFEGVKELLELGIPMIIFIEIHPYIEEKSKNDMFSKFAEENFEIISVISNGSRSNVKDYNELRDIVENNNTELILRRDGQL